MQGQKWGAERAWGEGGSGWGLCGAGPSPSAPRHKQPPAPTSREHSGPNDFWKVPELVFQGVWGGEQVSGRAKHERGAWTSSEFTQLCTRVPGDTLTARSRMHPTGRRQACHPQPPEHECSAAQEGPDPMESCSIVAHRPRRPAASVLSWGSQALGLLSVVAFGGPLRTPPA